MREFFLGEFFIRTSALDEFMESKKERVVHAADEVLGRDHRVAENERGDAAISVRCNTHSHLSAQRITKDGGAAGNHLLQKWGNIVCLVADAVAVSDAAGTAVAAQIECENLEAGRKLRE
jgi:hypothetical protein